jgi:hypothetical protein
LGDGGPGGSGTTPGAVSCVVRALLAIALAKKRVQSILDRDTVAHQQTLEQKIAEQGPEQQRVDPHLVGLAVMDLLELNRLSAYTHPATQTKSSSSRA